MRLTEKQLARYQKYLEELRESAVLQKKRVGDAAAQGDLSENAEYDAAQLELSKINKKIALLEDALADYTIIEPDADNSIIGIGSIVTISYIKEETGIPTLDGDGEDYEIVEISTISIPNSTVRELTTASLVGRKILGRRFEPDKDNVVTYTDNDNIVRYLRIRNVQGSDANADGESNN